MVDVGGPRRVVARCNSLSREIRLLFRLLPHGEAGVIERITVADQQHAPGFGCLISPARLRTNCVALGLCATKTEARR